MSGFHAPISPSSLALTVACNAWLALSAGLPPEPDKPVTLEGNAADWVAKETARGREPAYGSPTPVPGYPVDYDMLHGARLWASVLGYGSNSGTPVIIDRIHPQCWGEPDGWKYDGIEQILHLPDYKFGFDLVEVYENWQLLAYAVGLIDMLGLDDQVVRVRFTIVQPRAFHPLGPVRVWEVVADRLRPLANIARNAAARALEKTQPPEATAGSHCMTLHCPARFRCPTLRLAASHVAEWSRSGETVEELEPAAIGAELTILNSAHEILKARRTGLEAQAEQLMRMGRRVPGFKMEAAATRLAWKDDVTVDEVLGLGTVIRKDLRKPLTVKNGLVTPTQAINAGVPAATIDLYAARPNGAVTIVVDDGSEARRVFGGGS